MKIGDVNRYYNHKGWKRDLKLFEEMDVNDIKDERLLIQNKNII